MNKVNITYRNLLFENGLNINGICENYKKQLNILIQENTPWKNLLKVIVPTSQNNICTEEAQRAKQYINNP